MGISETFYPDRFLSTLYRSLLKSRDFLLTIKTIERSVSPFILNYLEFIQETNHVYKERTATRKSRSRKAR